MTLSIIFPAFDEELKIGADILRASEFLESHKISGEIIVVDDGSSDNTYKVANELINSVSSKLIVIKHNKNLGKGFAVKSGIMKASNEFFLYSDAGNIVPFENSFLGIELIKRNKADIAHGSRKLESSNIIKEQDSDRKMASWLFYKFIRGYLKIPETLTDTQCGFKIYKNDVAKKLFSELEISGFLFEIEIILKALKSKFRIAEFPVQWKCDRDSRISFLKTTPDVIRELLKIKRILNQ